MSQDFFNTRYGTFKLFQVLTLPKKVMWSSFRKNVEITRYLMVITSAPRCLMKLAAGTVPH